MRDLPPEVLVRLCQQTLPDDTRAFEALVGHFKSRVFATSYRLMSNRQDAEDQTQEVFLKVYRGVKDLSDPADIASWIYRITVNTCFDALGRRQRSPNTTSIGTVDGDQEEQLQHARAETPEEAALQRELRRCLETALQTMDLPERAVLVLRDVEGRPYQEIADTLALGLSAVKMRIHRARVAFQKLFEQICPGLWRNNDLPDVRETASS
jgi:RNA polymerase sigma-70 factor, ECF subfamily